THQKIIDMAMNGVG
ncbi:IS1-like element transposase, partial [Escherichia coli]